MGIIAQANTSTAQLAAVETADQTRVLIVLKLMEMNWPTLDQQAATQFIDKYLKKAKLLSAPSR